MRLLAAEKRARDASRSRVRPAGEIPAGMVYESPEELVRAELAARRVH
jgi:hypothetical protein